MKFTKSHLLAAIDKALEIDAVARAKADAAEAVVVEARRNEWEVKARPKFRELRDALTKALKKPHVTDADLPAEWRHIATYVPVPEDDYALRRQIDTARKPYVGNMVHRTEFLALRAALEALVEDGDVITDRQLQTLGFGSRAVADVYRAALA